MGIQEREMTEGEYARVKAGFDRYAIECGNPPEKSDRFGFVASEDGQFVGCSSGLAYKKLVGYADWFYLSDLFVEKPYRGRDIGSQLLHCLERKVAAMGIGHIWTWTAGYEAPSFYRKLGYEVFCEMPGYYSSGHSRIGLRKALDRNRVGPGVRREA